MTQEPPPYVDATGVARRLQALACAGYGLDEVTRLLGCRRLTVQGWRQHRRRQVRTETHDWVNQLYDRLWDTDGPSKAARDYAARHRWQPFEAWTDKTIDDPTAGPYSDPEAVEYLDWVLLDQVVNKKQLFLELSRAEQLYLFRGHTLNGGSPRSFRDRYRPLPAPLLRWLQENA